jgi:hypothetical protein
MHRIAPSQLLRIFATTAVILLLTPLSPAVEQQKSAPPLPNSQAQLEARVKDLEARLTAAEQKAASAEMQKDYILRTQNHYEAYYKDVFSTQTHILWTIGITVTLLSVTLSAVFFVAGRFGFNMFDRRIDLALRDATAQLREEFTSKLAGELKSLKNSNDAQMNQLEQNLKERIGGLENDLKVRSDFQFRFSQALTMGSDDRFEEARRLYRRALESYKAGKPRELIAKESAVRALKNIFRVIQRADKKKFVGNARKELADQFYNDLLDELTEGARDLTWLGPLILQRHDATPAPESASTESPEPAMRPEEPTPAPPTDPLTNQ